MSCCWWASRCCCCCCCCCSSAGLAFWSSPDSSPSSVFSADSRMSRCKLPACGLLRGRLELQGSGNSTGFECGLMCQEGAGVAVGAGAATSPAVTLVCSPWGACRTALHPVCCGVGTGCCPLHGALRSTSSVSSSCGGQVCPPMASHSSTRVSHCSPTSFCLCSAGL